MWLVMLMSLSSMYAMRSRTDLDGWMMLSGTATGKDLLRSSTSSRGKLRCEDQIPSVSFAETTVGIRTSVNSLGVKIDSGLTFNEHVDNICKASAYHIRSLRHIRGFIDEDAATSVATALVSARIDYCNSLLYGTSKSNIDKLRRLQNSLARAVMCTGKFDSITPVLAALHWLPISARITYKVALLTRKV